MLAEKIIFALLGAGLLTVGAVIGYNMGRGVGKKKKDPRSYKLSLLPQKLLDPVVPGEEDDPLVKAIRSQGQRSS